MLIVINCYCLLDENSKESASVSTTSFLANANYGGNHIFSANLCRNAADDNSIPI